MREILRVEVRVPNRKRVRPRILFYPKKNPTSMDLVRDLPIYIHKHLLRNKYSTLANEFREIGFLTVMVNACVMLHSKTYRTGTFRQLVRLEN